jgi:hypothetical protein
LKTTVESGNYPKNKQEKNESRTNRKTFNDPIDHSASIPWNPGRGFYFLARQPIASMGYPSIFALSLALAVN